MSKIGRVFMVAALCASLGVAAAAPAGAAGGTTCAKPTGKITVTPALGSTPTKVTASLNMPLKSCKGGGVTSGLVTGKLTETASLGSIASKPVSMAITIKWNTGKTSNATIAVATKGLTATVKGKVSKGLFVGNTVTAAANVKLAIAGGKLSSITLTGTSGFAVK